MQYLQYVQPYGSRKTYSNTNLVINDMNFRFEFDYLYFEEQITSGDWSECLGTGYPSKFRFGSNPQVFVIYGGSDYKAPNNTVLDGAVTIDKTGLWLNDTKIINIGSVSSSISPNRLTLGGDYQYPGDAIVKSNTKIGRLRVYNNDVLVADFRPAQDNGSVGFYDEVGQVFYDSDGEQPWIAGPSLSSIVAEPSKTSLAATGETINIVVDCENAWTLSTSGGSFLTFSSTGDTIGATITATAPSYSLAVPREEWITFTDTVTNDTAEVKIKQKKYSTGQPFYLGGDEITEIYLGGDTINEAYLGEVLVFSTGPFQGLKLNPKSLKFDNNTLSATLKIKSSEAWTATTPAWVTASVLTGDTGETTITLTTTAQTAATIGSIVVTSANYEASASCEYNVYNEMAYIYEPNQSSFDLSHSIDTGIAHTASTMDIEIEYQGMGSGSFSDRMVGYAQNDPGCTSDSNDFRVFGYSSGTYDYKTFRNWLGGNINSGNYHFRIGDCYCYDIDNEVYKCQGTAFNTVPSPNCHIYVDVSRIKVKSVKIKDGNTVLFDGVAAELGGQYGLWDRVGSQLVTNTDITITGDAISA